MSSGAVPKVTRGNCKSLETDFCLKTEALALDDEAGTNSTIMHSLRRTLQGSYRY
ncbi:MAG: hypothetical protein V4676_02360 [Bacteroidota bacterium]